MVQSLRFWLLPVLALPLAAQAQTPKPAPKSLPRPAAKPAARPAAPTAPTRLAAPARPVAAPTPAPPAPAVRVGRTAAPAAGPFGVGTSVLNLGLGLGSRYGYGAGLLGGSSSVTPAFSLSYERGIRELGPGYLGVGGIVGYQRASYDFGLGYAGRWHYDDLVLNLRGAFHYPVPGMPQLDAYGGLGLGVRYLRDTYDSGAGSSSSGSAVLAAGLYLGARYFFTSSFGGFAELGYDQSFLKLGLAAKF